MAKLLVTSHPDHMVANLSTFQDNGQRRFIGRAWNYETKRFELKQEAEVVSDIHHYVQAVKQGALIPADQATADLCGVVFKAPKKQISSASKE